MTTIVILTLVVPPTFLAGAAAMWTLMSRIDCSGQLYDRETEPELPVETRFSAGTETDIVQAVRLSQPATGERRLRSVPR